MSWLPRFDLSGWDGCYADAKSCDDGLTGWSLSLSWFGLHLEFVVAHAALWRRDMARLRCEIAAEAAAAVANYAAEAADIAAERAAPVRDEAEDVTNTTNAILASMAEGGDA